MRDSYEEPGRTLYSPCDIYRAGAARERTATWRRGAAERARNDMALVVVGREGSVGTLLQGLPAPKLLASSAIARGKLAGGHARQPITVHNVSHRSAAFGDSPAPRQPFSSHGAIFLPTLVAETDGCKRVWLVLG